MRLTTKIATSGISGLSRFPTPRATFDQCLNEQGRLDPIKARHALNCEQIQIGSNDDIPCMAFTFEFLRQMEAVSSHFEPKAKLDTKNEARCERNLKKGRYAFCRTDITSCLDGIHVKLSIHNPREVVGNTENYARIFGVFCARILLYLKSSITTTTVHLLEGEGAEGIYEEGQMEEQRAVNARKRKTCPNRKNGCFCSPIDKTCPLYENGKCREP